jgi:hypothetical protein
MWSKRRQPVRLRSGRTPRVSLRCEKLTRHSCGTDRSQPFARPRRNAARVASRRPSVRFVWRDATRAALYHANRRIDLYFFGTVRSEAVPFPVETSVLCGATSPINSPFLDENLKFKLKPAIIVNNRVPSILRSRNGEVLSIFLLATNLIGPSPPGLECFPLVSALLSRTIVVG